MPRFDEEKQVGPGDTAISKKQPFPNTCEGKVVSITGDKLVMTNQEGQEYSHTLAEDVKLTRDGTLCQAEDLKAGSKIRVTTKQNDRRVAIGIESLDKNVESAQCCH